MEIVRCFKKVERSYHSTPNGWRLATCEEATIGLESIKENQVIGRWERARLLDGWMSGSGYGYEIRSEFRGCMGYMILIQTQTSAEDESGTPYGDVNLSEFGKEVALFLCVDDWNYEVVYWLLNSWSKSHTMTKLSDVRGGNVPFVNAAEFKKMNKRIGRLARRLADEEVAAREKGRTTKYTGSDSVKEVLSSMMQIVREEGGEVLRGHEYYLPDFAQTGDVAEVFWSFVCETYAGRVVEARSLENLKMILSMKTKGKSVEKNLKIATFILRCLAEYRSDIIHEPLPHTCWYNCAAEFLSDMEGRAGGEPDRFSEMLKHNAMWRCYDDTGNYGVLNKLLFSVTQRLATAGKVSGAVVEMLLKCGTEPAGCYAINNDLRDTTLHKSAIVYDRDVSREVAQLLLAGCDDAESRTRFVNAVNENGMTALHIASQQGNASLCELLIKFNGSVNAQDNKGMTPLHHALEGERDDELINVLMRSSQAAESVDLRDKRGNAPLDEAIEKKDYTLIAKWLPMSKEAEHYLSKVDDQKQLLRYSLLVGSADIAENLYGKDVKLPAGNVDEDGKTALHLAAMRDDKDSAKHIIKFILSRLSTPGQDKTMVSEYDRRGRTVLHEAALKGHEEVCKILLHINPKLLYIKDRDRRNPLFDLVEGKYKPPDRLMRFGLGRESLLNEWVQKDMPVEDLTDRRGLTPLHVAVSQGNAEIVEHLLSSDRFREKYISRGDFLGQTALHKAAKRGDIGTMKLLLDCGAHPLRERDCDGRTALHYAVQAETGDKVELAEAIFKRCESKDEESLLLWASAAGLGTADQNLTNNDSLREILLKKKGDMEIKKDANLLRTAACVGDFEMTKELIIRGYQMGEILNNKWRKQLDRASQRNVIRVSKLIDTIKEQANDRPAIEDTLGRVDYAQGIAALLLNPYIKPPIAVGITGTWGMGKSSLMFQTEQILLSTAAQIALLESSKLPTAALELPNIKSYKLSRKGGKKCEYIYKHIYGKSINRNLDMKIIQKELAKFLSNKYDIKNRKVFKSLAAMDNSDMFDLNDPLSKENPFADGNMLETNAEWPKLDRSTEENVPAVLTVQYNAWKYSNDTEALAGMAVEITKELEGVMTQAQWLSTCCRNTWRKNKYTLWVEIFFPSLLTLVLVSSLTWIIWVLFDSDKLKEWGRAKYAWPPAAMVVTVWTVTRSIMGILKPVSTQLMQYISFPDHSDKLGYQETVISDIKFLKDEIGKKAYKVFIVFGWILTTFTVLWHLITESWLWATSLFFHHRSFENFIEAPKVTPASGTNLRIIVFVDDLDRCHESVILQVLSAINLVLAECEINVVMGMDKRLIQRAIMKQYGDGKKTSQELADMYLQKIIQLPLDLPDPSDEESRRFLKAQLGVYEHGEKAPSESGTEESVNENREEASSDSSGEKLSCDKDSDEGSSSSDEEEEGEQQNAPPQVHISMPVSSGEGEMNMQSTSESNCLNLFKFSVTNIAHALRALCKAKKDTGTQTEEEEEDATVTRTQTEEEEEDATVTRIQQNSSSPILLREMLFVRYSKGEENAFLYFQGLATDSRKLPREWKRLLTYHRLVWYIFSVGKEARNLAGWQVQLITWIFVCWEWQENMNLVITKWKEIKWKEIRDLKTSESNEPSLLMIVEHLMEEHEKENQNKTATGKEEDAPIRTELLGKAGGILSKIKYDIDEIESSDMELEKLNGINDKEEIQSSDMELEKLKGKGEGKIPDITDGEGSIAHSTDDNEIMEKGASEKLVKEIDKLEILEKSLAELMKEIKKIKESASDDLKEEMKTLIKRESDELKEEMKELKKKMCEEFKGEMKDLKEGMKERRAIVHSLPIGENGTKEQIIGNKKNKLQSMQNWKRMKSTLERYDVSMDGIQAFQKFRFYCIAGYLPCPC